MSARGGNATVVGPARARDLRGTRDLRGQLGALALAAPLLGALLLTGCAGGGEQDAPEPGEGEATTAPAPPPQGPPDDDDTDTNADDETDDDADEPDSDIPQTDLDGAEQDEGADDGGTSLPEQTPQQVDEAPELVGESQATWEGYEELSETELEIMFYSGNPSCYGVRSVVEEDAEEVRIATISGRLPEAEDQPCTQEALYVSLLVELEEPLGDRDVVELQEVDLD